MEIYYNISEKIISIKKMNYKILNNINECINFNFKVIQDIREIILDKNMNNKINKIINIFNKIDDYNNISNYIIREIEIKKNDVNKGKNNKFI